MASGTTYLITGANRGIGLGLSKAVLSRPNTTLIAGVRSVAASTETLKSISTGTDSKLIIVKLDSTSLTDAGDAVKELESKHGISHVDVVIANAGIAKYYGPVATTPIEEFTDHHTVNTIAVVTLFQAFLPLLDKSSNAKFVTISSGIGSIGLIPHIPMPAAAYGASKAALNYITRKIQFENPKLIAFPMNPGWVQTDMGNMGAKASGMEQAPVSIEESVNGIIKTIDNATRETGVANLASFDANDMPY